MPAVEWGPPASGCGVAGQSFQAVGAVKKVKSGSSVAFVFLSHGIVQCFPTCVHKGWMRPPWRCRKRRTCTRRLRTLQCVSRSVFFFPPPKKNGVTFLEGRSRVKVQFNNTTLALHAFHFNKFFLSRKSDHFSRILCQAHSFYFVSPPQSDANIRTEQQRRF